MIIVNEDTYEEEVLNHDGIVLIDYFAEWCGPCKGMAIVLEGLEANEAWQDLDNAKIVKIDVDESPTLASEAGMRGVPAYKVVIKGEVQDRMMAGAKTQSEFIDFVNQ